MNTKGISHLLVPIIVVISAALAGTFMLVSSKADSVPVASVASAGCPGRSKMVNAKPEDFFSKKYRDAAIQGNGLMCVNKTRGREVVSGPNNNTIVDYYKCSSGHVFAYDKRNTDGTGFKVRWKLQSFNGAEDEGHVKKTYYCIKKTDLYVSRIHSGEDLDHAKGAWYTSADKHIYKFWPAFSEQEACSGAKLKFTGCKQNYFFSYYGGGDIRNR